MEKKSRKRVKTIKRVKQLTGYYIDYSGKVTKIYEERLRQETRYRWQ